MFMILSIHGVSKDKMVKPITYGLSFKNQFQIKLSKSNSYKEIRSKILMETCCKRQSYNKNYLTLSSTPNPQSK